MKLSQLFVILKFLLLIHVVAAIVYGSFLTYRWFNYKFGYQVRVQHEIREMVKKECLK